MKHPSAAAQKNQAEFLKNCPPGRRALLSEDSTGLSTVDAAATEEGIQHWLEGFPGNIQKDMQAKGFEKCRTHAPFTRHVMEGRDIGMDAWWSPSE